MGGKRWGERVEGDLLLFLLIHRGRERRGRGGGEGQKGKDGRKTSHPLPPLPPLPHQQPQQPQNRIYVLIYDFVLNILFGVWETGELWGWDCRKGGGGGERGGEVGETVLMRVGLGHKAMVKCGVLERGGEGEQWGAKEGKVKLWSCDVAGELRVWEFWEGAGAEGGVGGKLVKSLKGGKGGRDVGLSMTVGGGGVWVGSGVGVLRRFDVGEGEGVKEIEGHKGGVWAMEWVNQKKWVVSGGDDGFVKVWEGGKGGGELLYCFEGHREKVVSLRVSVCGGYVFSGSFDRCFCMCDLGVVGKGKGKEKGGEEGGLVKFEGYHDDTVSI